MLTMTFTIGANDDEKAVGGLFARLAAAFSGADVSLPAASVAEEPAPAAASRRAPRNTKAADPVEQYNKLAAEAGAATVVETKAEPESSAAADVSTQDTPAVAETAADPAADREALLKRAREVAKDKGAIWLRGHLQKANTAKISDLPDAALADVAAGKDS